MATTRNFTNMRTVAEFPGTGANDNDVMITVEDARQYDAFILMSTVGAVDIQINLNGTGWSTAPLSLTDMGAVTTDPVLVTAANRVYGFRGVFRGVRVLQNGATGATASLMCGNL